MNSLVQEASSIAKAVELAWEKAGKPVKFSVRVFQEATKNFLGMTKENAKIALLFEAKDVPVEEAIQKKPEQKKYVQEDRKKQHKHEQQRRRIPEKQQRQQKNYSAEQPKPVEKKEIQAPKHEKKMKSKELWTDEMVAIARNWMKDMLAKMGKSDVQFTTDVKRYHLKFYFNEPISENMEEQKNFFRNFAHLIMQTIRNRLKKQLRYHKVVITSEKETRDKK